MSKFAQISFSSKFLCRRFYLWLAIIFIFILIVSGCTGSSWDDLGYFGNRDSKDDSISPSFLGCLNEYLFFCN